MTVEVYTHPKIAKQFVDNSDTFEAHPDDDPILVAQVQGAVAFHLKDHIYQGYAGGDIHY